MMVLNNLKKMVNLTELELVRCDLERIPHSIFSLHNLQVRLHLVSVIVHTRHNYWNGVCKPSALRVFYAPSGINFMWYMVSILPF